MTIELHWGILGAGNISGQFVHDLVRNNSLGTEYKHIVESIGCSTISKGENFIAKNLIVEEHNGNVRPVVQDYEKFYENPDVQIVYIGTPHHFHKEQVISCLENGKHVLCEKPFTINAKDSRELYELAKTKKLFLMEAVWTRFFPTMRTLQKLIFEDHIIGDLKRLFVDFTFDADIENLPPTSRVRDNKLGGGALLDIGVYCITYARMLLDDKVAPNNDSFEIKSFQEIDATDSVDYISSFLIKYASGKQAILSCSNWGDLLPNTPFLKLQGTKGVVEIYGKNAARPELTKIYIKGGGETLELKEDDQYNGFIYEANAVADDLQRGILDNDTIPSQETVLVMDIMDSIRKENGLIYAEDSR